MTLYQYQNIFPLMHNQMLFLGWCMAPIQSNGAQFLYHRFIKPFILKHQAEIESSLDQAQSMASSTLSEGMLLLSSFNSNIHGGPEKVAWWSF